MQENTERCVSEDGGCEHTVPPYGNVCERGHDGELDAACNVAGRGIEQCDDRVRVAGLHREECRASSLQESQCLR